MFVDEEQYYKLAEGVSAALVEIGAQLKMLNDTLSHAQQMMDAVQQVNMDFNRRLVTLLERQGVNVESFNSIDIASVEEAASKIQDAEALRPPAVEWATETVRRVYEVHGIGKVIPSDVQELEGGH